MTSEDLLIITSGMIILLSYLTTIYNFKLHLPFLYVLTIMAIFFFFSPSYGYYNEVKVSFFNYIWDYYPNVLFNYLLAILSFIIGYFIIIRKKDNVSYSTVKKISKNEFDVKYVRIGLIFVVFCFILWGLTAGRSIIDLFMLSLIGFNTDSVVNQLSKGNYYLLAMIEMSIPLLTIALFTKMSKKEFIFWNILILIIFITQGFRYRIILLVSSYLLVYLYTNKITLKKIILVFTLLTIIISSIILFTNYRNAFRDASKGVDIQKIEDYSAKRTIGATIFASTRSYVPFASLIKYMDEKNIPYGYGETMFGHIFIRMIPSFFFKDGIKPRPPAIDISAKSYGSQDALYAGEAYAAVGGVYYEFGTLGVVVFFFLLGKLIRFINIKLLTTNNILILIFYITVTVTFFQLITRGYLPGFFFTFGFIILPFLYFKIFKKGLWIEK